MFTDNPNFYPTPKKMIERMARMVQGHPKRILEPSAGKGDLIEGLRNISFTRDLGEEFKRNRYVYSEPFHNAEFSAIESDPNLQATLRGKSIPLLDSDFLNFSGPDKFDLIIANPPFDNGDKHLLKAIEIMYRGQIVFLLNAETIRNPHTNTRKLLLKKLDELGAKIKFYKNAFATDAERKTKVDVALVYIKIDRKVEDDLFADASDTASRSYEKVKSKHEVSTGKTIEELVAEYNQILQMGTEVIISYYRNYNKVGKYIGLDEEADKYPHRSADEDLTTKMQNRVNTLAVRLRRDFWRRVLDLDEVNRRLTRAKQEEFEHALNERSNMDFTEANIRQFIINLIGSYEQTLIEAVMATFDKFTRHGFRDNCIYEENIHYFNGWKTNSAFKVNKRVVIPIYGSYGGPFTDYGRWNLNYAAAQTLDDFDKVANYFDGMAPGYLSITQAIERAFASGQSRKIVSTYFTVNCFKKGTIHITFNDEDILRRFNVVACRGKGWLPDDYGTRKYAALPAAEKAIVDSFEGKASYAKHVGKPLIDTPQRLALPTAA